MPQPEDEMPKRIKDVLIPAVVIGLICTSLVSKFQLDMAGMLVLAQQVGALFLAIWAIFTRTKLTKVESIAPIITKIPKGMEVTTTVTVNDPTNDLPPAEFTHKIDKSP